MIEQLDIVAANKGLQFPANVSLNFVYWEHKDVNLPDLPPYLQSADAIAWEAGSIDLGDRYTPIEAGRRLEKVMSHAIQGIATRDEWEFIREVEGAIPKVEMIRSLPKLPRLHLVDDYAGMTTADLEFYDSYLSHRIYDGIVYVQDNFHYAEDVFVRENTTLNQLATIATRLGKDGENKQLAIVYGANHTLLSVAARGLGAIVERHFAHEPKMDYVMDTVVKLIRFNLLPTLDRIDQEDLRAIIAATAIDSAIGHKRMGQGPLYSAATLLELVRRLDPSLRDSIHERSSELNDYTRKKLLGEKGQISKGRLISRLPAAIKIMRNGAKIERDLLNAAIVAEDGLKISA